MSTMVKGAVSAAALDSKNTPRSLINKVGRANVVLRAVGTLNASCRNALVARNWTPYTDARMR